MSRQPASTGGRPRDADLDAAILDAARAIANERGITALTFARVAERAGTTRPALYRRYASPTELAVATLASMAGDSDANRIGDGFRDLVAELSAFRRAITRAHSITLVGGMLGGEADPEVQRTYRTRIVMPRRRAIARILSAARDAGELAGSADDHAVAVAMCTGSWYAFALAGTAPPADWPSRTAALVWRALGGHPPGP